MLFQGGWKHKVEGSILALHVASARTFYSIREKECLT